MACLVHWTEQAGKDLSALDSKVASRIVRKVDTYAASPHTMQFAKSLSGSFQGLYRFRIGDYRVIFDRNNQGEWTVLLILQIDHRKDIYD